LTKENQIFPAIPSVNPPPFDLSDIFRESSNQEPILLILAGGADPSQELEKLAANTIGLHNYTSISMGQGQEQATIDGIRRASSEGQWLCLQNVHLMLSIIPVIQKELATVTPHEKFRLMDDNRGGEQVPSNNVAAQSESHL
ncbi:hypothetical protein COOONC_18791, partial [Cooperia oncophora]